MKKNSPVVNQNESKLLTVSIGAIYPFVIIFGFYVIINGHRSPGGGFQGGAILAAVFIIQYFADRDIPDSLAFLTYIEKIFYLALILLVTLVMFEGYAIMPSFLKEYYLIIMNTLIGIKVFCGLSIIFYRFILFESR